MVIREHAMIDAAPEAVWGLIADPRRMAGWNPKIVLVDRQRDGLVETGERFQMTFRMGNRDRPTEVEAIEQQHAIHLTLRFHPIGWPRERFCDERFKLRQVASDTKLTHEIDFGHSGISWPIQVLIWAIFTLGEYVGKSYMENLRDLATTPAGLQRIRGDSDPGS